MPWPKGKTQAVDLTEQKFNRLTVHSRNPRNSGAKAHWNCVCDCGKDTVVASYDLKRGHTKSCGCFDLDRKRIETVKHGFCRTQTYTTWSNMRARCHNKDSDDYHNYGGRGISVCDRWMTFENFLEDMGEKPEGMSIDRIEVNGNYEPGNCRWANQETQDNNKRTTVYVNLNGKRMSMSQASKILGCTQGKVRYAVQKYKDDWINHFRAAAAIGQSMKEQGK